MNEQSSELLLGSLDAIQGIAACDRRRYRAGMEFHMHPETGKTADCDATINIMIPVWLIVVGVLYALVVLYFAIKYREFRKFLSGAFFVSSGVLFYLWFTKTPVPIIGIGFVETPAISGVRAAIHFVLFLLTFYFGFIHKPKRSG